MILYYAPGACSQAPHIILNEAGIAHETAQVNLSSKTLDDGTDYGSINPKGAVPALKLDDGQVLTENAVILQYIAERAGDEQLLPATSDFRRYRVLEWLNFIATELHKSFGPLFNPASGEETKKQFRDLIGKKLDYLEGELGSGPYLAGEPFTLADAYLFVILGWAGKHGIDLTHWANLAAFRERMSQRPAVPSALRAEGLLEAEMPE